MDTVSGGIAFMSRFDVPGVQAQKIAKVKKSGHRVIAALGLRDDYLTRAEKCLKAGADGFLPDAAHGHMDKMLETIKIIKAKLTFL